MRRYWQYFKYIARHKWYVFKACLRLGVPVWRAVIHDWTKFSIAEFIPYARFFYTSNGTSRFVLGDTGYKHVMGSKEDFDQAWKHHWQNNPHHWEYWNPPDPPLIQGIDLKDYVIEMPETYVREMVADWIGAGLAQGRPDTPDWWMKNRTSITLDPFAIVLVIELLRGQFPKYDDYCESLNF